ncbi:TetR/AcrR family transcriptional regulator [Nocardioides xinjiangensis]|uniref:TetR/AcrR family transcriptional regulator n=1 Tax=Nocardioides xinjiangensis TaxID=2817376 RepID=UPI001B316AE9|nr:MULTISPECIES: TetR/AcrR family transcriptional regulator [unclassified Nocardioides]
MSTARSGATDAPPTGPSDASIIEAGRRRRGRALEDAILDAAHDEFAEHGWEGFTVEAVALRSGAAKSVIYRRWRNRVDLALAVLERANVPAPGASMDGHGIRADLLEFLTGMARFLRTPFGAAVRGVERDGDVDGRVSIFHGDAQVAIVQDIVDRAVAHGELDHQPSVLAMNLGHAIVMSEFVRLHRPPDDDALAELVDTIWLPALRHTTRSAPGSD